MNKIKRYTNDMWGIEPHEDKHFWLKVIIGGILCALVLYGLMFGGCLL